MRETGRVIPTPAQPVIRFDTSAGIVDCLFPFEEHDPNTVSLENVPAFVAERAVPLDITDLGRIVVDVAFGGNFFALVSARQAGLSLCPKNASDLSRWGLDIRNTLNDILTVRHPEIPGINHVALTLFYEEEDSPAISVRTVAVFGAGQIDRSPCGTGTSALMAFMHARGKLPIGSELSALSIIGTKFTGTPLATCQIGDFPAIRPRITGSAYITGINQFVLDPDDPLPRGFQLD